MAGRPVRHFADWGTLWILDSCFDRVRKTLPKWFNSDIIQDFDYLVDTEPEVVCTEKEDEDFNY